MYEAEDMELDTHIALKMIRPDAGLGSNVIERFKREIQTARTVAHPNVCRTFDLGYHVDCAGTKVAFLTMELLCGETLSGRLKRVARMTVRDRTCQLSPASTPWWTASE